MEVPYVVQVENMRRQEQYARDNPAIAVFEELRNQIERFKKGLEEGVSGFLCAGRIDFSMAPLAARCAGHERAARW